MIMNRLIVPEGNWLKFTVRHMEGDKEYELKQGEAYYMVIAAFEEPEKPLLRYVGTDNFIDMDHQLPEGRYIFEIGVMEKDGDFRIILPSMDERHQPLNELLVLRRIS